MWQPIETAPRDGTVIDLWWDYMGSGERLASCKWEPYLDARPGETCWRQMYAEAPGAFFDVFDRGAPTYWMPLLEPPQ